MDRRDDVPSIQHPVPIYYDHPPQALSGATKCDMATTSSSARRHGFVWKHCCWSIDRSFSGKSSGHSRRILLLIDYRAVLGHDDGRHLAGLEV